MSGTLMTIEGANFAANAAFFIPAVSDGLVGMWHLGGTVAQTQRNLKVGGTAATLVGSPTINAGSVDFGGYATGQWLELPYYETDDITLLVVAKSSDTFVNGDQKPMFISSFGTDSGSGGALIGASIYVDGGTAPAGTVRLGGGQNNAGTYTAYVSTTFSTTDVSVFNFFAGSMAAAGGTGSRVLYNKTTAQSNNTSPSYPRRSNTVRPIRVGASHSSSFSGTCAVSYVAVFNRVLTAAEITSLYTAEQSRQSTLYGVTI
jgi:hypothetical protein